MNYKKLSDVAYYSELRTRDITIENYITTDNMLPNIGGICTASSIPDCKTARYYEEGDILLSNIRPYFCKIWYADRCGSASNDVLVIKNKEDIDSKFLYYVLCDKNFFNYDTVTSKGTKMPRGTPNAIMKYLVPDVDDKVQKKIASVLSAYDDLIEKNNRKIQILQDIAEELYKEWFVRFRFPGHETSKFTDGIPDGWEYGRISNLCSLKNGYAFPSSSFEDIGDCGIIKIENVLFGDIKIDKCSYVSNIDEKKLSSFKLKSKDILIAMTGAQIGKTGRFPNSKRTFYLNQRVGKFVPHNPNIVNNQYLYQYTQTKAFITYIENYANGAAQPNISGKQIENIKMLIPSSDLLRQYELKVDSMLDEIQLLKEQNDNLKQQRDLLLPRLMSGKLAVKVS